MKLNKALKFSLGVLITFPLSFIVGNEILANNLTERFEYSVSSNNLIACGGGGGGGGGATPAAKAAAKKKKAKAKLSFKKRALAKAAAAGEDTSKLAAEIAAPETLIAE